MLLTLGQITTICMHVCVHLCEYMCMCMCVVYDAVLCSNAYSGS